MKRTYWCLILLAVTVISTSCSNTVKQQPTETTEIKPNTIRWHELTDAKTLATEQGKDIFVFVHTEWCPKCEAYKQGIFLDSQLVEILNQHFIPVMLNAETPEDITWEGKVYSNPDYDQTKGPKEKNSYHELPIALGAQAIPNILVLDQSLNNIGELLGLYEADRLKWYLANATGRYNYTLGSNKK